MFKLAFLVLAVFLVLPLFTSQAYRNEFSAYIGRLDLNMELPSVQASLDRAGSFLGHPEYWFDSLQSGIRSVGTSLASMANSNFNLFEKDRYADAGPAYGTDATFYGGYSSSEMYRLYEEAYPGYHKTMRINRESSHNWGADDYSGSVGTGFSNPMNRLGNLGGGFGNLGSGFGNGFGGGKLNSGHNNAPMRNNFKVSFSD